MRYYTTLCSKRELLLFGRCCKQVLLFCLAIGSFHIAGQSHARAVQEAGSALSVAIASTPTAFPPQRFQLRRPVDQSAADDRPDRFYPYGSTGQGRYPVHRGVEFVNPIGTPVLAVSDGTVVVAGKDDREVWGPHPDYYGLLVVIRLAQSFGELPVYVLYGHLARVWVTLGQQVQSGEAIGQVGMSGVAIGPHLHLEVRLGRNSFDRTYNPEFWLAPLPGHGTIAGRIEDDAGRLVEGALITFHRGIQLDKYWQEAWTYARVKRERLGLDVAWKENFVLGDVPVGEYILRARVYGRLYTRNVVVQEGEVTFIRLVVHTDGFLPKLKIKNIIGLTQN